MFQEEKDLSQTGKYSDKMNYENEFKKNVNIENLKSDALKAQDAISSGNQMFNKPITPNEAEISNKKIWSNQPTSKIFNAHAIPENAIAGINRVINLDIHVEGKQIRHFKHFRLKQKASNHHKFEMVLAHDALGDPENHNLENAQAFLGKRITVVFKYKDVDQSPERNFVGVITEIGFSQEKGSLGDIVFKGYSPTILLDAAPHIQSFGGSQPISLNSVANEVIKEALDQGKFDFRVDSQHGNISYSCQYEETHFNYLSRIAEAYGEQFFYDGEILHFGKLPPQEKPIKLVYGSNLSDVKIKMKAQHVKPTFYGYNSSKDEKFIGSSSKITHTSDIAKRAYEISERTFQTPSLRVAPIKAISFMDIDASQRGTAGSKAAEVLVTSGKTSLPFLYPGCITDIEMRKPDSNETTFFTKLMVIEALHQVDARGYYEGSFKAIASDTGFLPRPEYINPLAEPQFAKVISNTDPQNQGRVQVQLDWQKGQDTTEFIRVMSPDAGSSDKVGKNRGFMSIPEVGDQVIVNYVHLHPDRPFVMGGMYHGGIGAGGGEGNNIKSLSSKSGNKLELNDGEGSVFLTDQGGANMKFDGAGNANTNATKNKSVSVGEKNTVTVGDIHKTDVGNGQSVLTMGKDGVIDLSSLEKLTLKVGDNSLEISTAGIKVNGAKIEITGEGSWSGGNVFIN
ncbi:Vgr family protein [Chryseobacterium indologenes]|uniref:Vgr family protein n=3 Tax=Chryseobacterium TaxID=59732 RepID=A0A3G6RM25_CHRLC|nr:MULTISPECIES: phage baseplate assembly protein V [Bacteroidota]AZA84555.1 Vgr family protein [Chryseobacterium lactis]AZB04943.1 Vgr family protein [Chryseobacterium lactis]MBF6643636.1 Vgr family protein [Chryseobacterium indologenes]PNW14674.1 Vgr family protein [Chryseobacterium lactis]QPQ52080.1 Vgr family protein [Chryseobacterium indologenes]